MRRISIVLLAGTLVSPLAVHGLRAGAGAEGAASCSARLERGGLGVAERRACVQAVAASWLDATVGRLPVSAVPFTDDAISYGLGPTPARRRDGGASARATLPKDVRRITDVEWVVDGRRSQAYATFTAHSTSSGPRPAYHESSRFTLRGGRIHEIVTSRSAPPGDPPPTDDENTGFSVIPGFPDDPGPHATRNPDDAYWCSNWLADHDAATLSSAEHERCVIAISTTYLDAEENSRPGWTILLDPRGGRWSPGGRRPRSWGAGDAVRASQGRTGVNAVIRDIANREWTVDGDTAWVRYDGYLVSSTTEPGFYVMERFVIRDGLIRDIFIPPPVACVPNCAPMAP